jgi:hypothetical protein
MRHPNEFAGRRLPAVAAGFVALAISATAVACGGSAPPSVAPTPLPTPVVTPDPHLTEPVTADQVFRLLGQAKLGIRANNANSGRGNAAIIKQINADVGNWPLRITQFRSSTDLQKTLNWKAGSKPVRNETPYAFAALNILIEYGPVSSAGVPTAPDDTRQALAAQIAGTLDPLLWPMAQHSVVAVPVRTPVPAATPAPSAAPTKAPAKPSARPSTKATKTPKPTKSP